MKTERFKEKRSGEPGRRAMDSHKCMFHDDFWEQILNCFITIKDRIKSLEDKMSGTMTVKIAGIITTVAMGFLILFIGAAFNMMQSLGNDIEHVKNMVISLESRSDNLLKKETETATRQESIIKNIDALKKDITEIKTKLNNGG